MRTIANAVIGSWLVAQKIDHVRHTTSPGSEPYDEESDDPDPIYKEWLAMKAGWENY